MPRRAFFGGMPPVIRDIVANMVRRKALASLVARDFTRAGLPAAEERMARVLDHLDARAPDNGFWLGESCTVADLGIFSQLHQLRMPAIPFRMEALARRKRLSAWLDRVEAATSGA